MQAQPSLSSIQLKAYAETGGNNSQASGYSREWSEEVNVDIFRKAYWVVFAIVALCHMVTLCIANNLHAFAQKQIKEDRTAKYFLWSLYSLLLLWTWVGIPAIITHNAITKHTNGYVTTVLIIAYLVPLIVPGFVCTVRLVCGKAANVFSKDGLYQAIVPATILLFLPFTLYFFLSIAVAYYAFPSRILIRLSYLQFTFVCLLMVVALLISVLDRLRKLLCVNQSQYKLLTDVVISEDRPSNGTSQDHPSNGTSQDSPSNGTSQDSPSNGTSQDSPSNGTSQDSPSNGTSQDSPSNGTSQDSPSNGTSQDSPSNGTSQDSPSNGTSQDSPSNGTSQDSPTNDNQEPQNYGSTRLNTNKKKIFEAVFQVFQAVTVLISLAFLLIVLIVVGGIVFEATENEVNTINEYLTILPTIVVNSIILLIKWTKHRKCHCCRCNGVKSN